ncbi:MAG TPA: OB-fold nucleic acid binding domain-containing protein [Mycobacteriales bacterium]|nr:OB-fold nucleic acid binding domain-containing protein [Mycobacteriales bacterium]
MFRSASATGGTRRDRLVRALRGLVADAEDLDAEDLREDVEQAGATAVARCARGDRVTVTGRLRSVVVVPRESAPAVEAELFDGSGSVRLIWLGRRRIPGIEPGRSLVARGRLARQGGDFVLYNPWYELKATGH